LQSQPSATDPSARIVTLRAPAKLNLALAVGPADESSGMHPICSWMVTIDLCDELTVTRLPEDRFSRYAIIWHEEARRKSEIDWPIQRDLAVRAHLALENHFNQRLPVQLKLEKRIPVGGGLGGGSSNAAAMLRAVIDLYQLDIPRDELVGLASGLGSDVPFFLRGGSAIVEGLGDRIDHHGTPRVLHAVVVFPEEGCPTGPVYHAFDEQPPGVFRRDDVHRFPVAISLSSDMLFNDLAEPAMQIAPGLREHLRAISTLAERPAHITGSGSTMFILCDDPIHAEFLAQAIEEQCDLPALAVRTI